MKLKSLTRQMLVLAATIIFFLTLSSSTEGQTTSARRSAEASLEYLRRVMDEFHERVYVYQDVSSPGNHFHYWAMIPDENAAVKINGSWVQQPYSGATAIRCEFSNKGGNNFGGFVLQNGVLSAKGVAPEANFGTVANAGLDLSGATSLTFWARGEWGGEVVEFFAGGVGHNPPPGGKPAPYPDSMPAVKITVNLTRDWKQYRLDLGGKDLRYVLGGFGWSASALKNPTGAVFYLDDIQYELNPERRAQRLNEPRFLRSYTTKPVQMLPDPVGILDLALRNSADTYDNALALLAFLAGGDADSVRRARLIGDAFVYASKHDRAFNEGQIRNSYSAGDLALPPGWTPNDRAATVRTPGFYDKSKGKFSEVRQESVDTGNNAWAMVALLALYRQTREPSYLQTARRIGEFIRTFRAEAGRYRGFQGGVDNPETSEMTRRGYASTEHNLDLYAAFSSMFRITGERRWAEEAGHARTFVDSMWDDSKRCYLTGTHNPNQRNSDPQQLPLDVQAWSVLALRDAPTLRVEALRCAEVNHRVTHDGFTGFDFNEDRDGVWFEGTAQMAVAYSAVSNHAQAERLRLELQRAQRTPPFGDRMGLAAACHDGLLTGFDFMYFRRLHIGATSWNVFAQLQTNPYYLMDTTPQTSSTNRN